MPPSGARLVACLADALAAFPFGRVMSFRGNRLRFRIPTAWPRPCD